MIIATVFFFFLVEWKTSHKKVGKMIPRETIKSIEQDKRLFFGLPAEKN